ncbi:SPFH domain/Band 7 family protein [Planifilum fimeticola]|uniref:SPFH domain/Band 7 family protein n=1 Tax=Planifilum fimeticola TaxID=201975 RepID=A0A2T0LB49_9BACL|nr:slipin family protein [Planifilum fimeticola]PRX38844.1 SPFH domain/Band 7 family protein [Planifilum fimeticola]
MVRICDDERGLLFKRGNYVKHLKPGTYFYPFGTVIRLKLDEPFSVPGKPIQLFLKDEELLRELTVVDVKDHELAIHYRDGKFAGVYTSGTYAFWNALHEHRFLIVDTRNPEVEPDIDPSLFDRVEMQDYFHVFQVYRHECGILYYDGVFQKKLEPGKYYFWKGPKTVEVQRVDLRQQQLEVAGQELMTADKVTLRLNFFCHYKVVDPLRVLEFNSFEDQIYIHLQLVLREYVGTLKLDALLNKKKEIGDFVLQKLEEKSRDFGVQFLDAGVKDIILPGDIKEILNTVLLAEKQAQANIITRREETASTRSLLNTAKLMDQNPTLYRLKELEYLERICEKVSNITLMGGGSLLEQLSDLLTQRSRPSGGGDKNPET